MKNGFHHNLGKEYQGEQQQENEMKICTTPSTLIPLTLRTLMTIHVSSSRSYHSNQRKKVQPKLPLKSFNQQTLSFKPS